MISIIYEIYNLGKVICQLALLIRLDFLSDVELVAVLNIKFENFVILVLCLWFQLVIIVCMCQVYLNSYILHYS